MSSRSSKEAQAQATAAGRRRIGWWAGGLILLVVVGLVAIRDFRGRSAPEGPDPAILVGRWLRPDGGYILQLSDPEPGGGLTATYRNPQPITVSRANWRREEGYLGVFIELRAPNYPGSTYQLVYDEANDRLVGLYYQAAMQRQFDVAFERTP